MRSLFITQEFPPQRGGVASFYYHVCQQLGPENVVVVAPPAIGSEQFDRKQRFTIVRVEWLKPPEFKVPFLTGLKRWYWRAKIHELVKKFDISYIHVGQVLPIGPVVRSHFKKYQTPYLVYTHGMDVLVPQTIRHKKILTFKALQSARHIIANSYFTLDHIVKLGIDKQKITVVHPCPNISTLEIDAENLSRLKKEYEVENKKVILTVGRLVDRKGVDTVINALPIVMRRFNNFKYLVVGSGPSLPRLKNLVSKHRLGNHVQFLTNIPNHELPLIYQLSDIFVMPTRQIGPDVEGFGIVYLEANVFAKPVVGARAGGAAEAIVDGKTGLLVEPDSVEQTAEAIVRLLKDQTYAKQLGIQGMQRVLDQFDWPTQIAKIKELLK